MKKILRYKSALTASLFCFTALAISGCSGITQKPVSHEELGQKLKADMTTVFQQQVPVTGPISLEEAIERALRYNLSHRLALAEEALAGQELTAARLALLPGLTATAGYSDRSNENASSSVSVLTNTESLEPSTSQDRDILHGDLSLAWNLLDFGVSYYRARQQSNRELLAVEKRRKAAQQLVQEVRRAYWLAAGTQKLSEPLDTLLEEAEAALSKAEEVKSQRLRPPLEMLRYQESLMTIVERIKTIRDELRIARPRLASLMNIPPGQSFEVVVQGNLEIPVINQSLEEMEEVALANRPDLIGAEYEIRISADEAKKELVRMLPGIELNLDGRYNSNSYLYNDSWITGGARITWGIMGLLTGPSRIKAAKTKEEIARSRQMLLSMAALAQIHISKLEYDILLREFQSAQAMKEIKQEISSNVALAQERKMTSTLENIRSATDVLIAQMQEYKTYARLQGAYGNVQATLGVDPELKTVTAEAM